MNEREQIEREIVSGIQRWQRDTAPVSTMPRVGRALMIGCLGAALLVALTHSAASQQLEPGNLTPGPVFCQGAQKHIKNVLSKTGMFKDAFALSGEGARQVSQNVFGHVPAADHIIIIRQVNAGSIMVPCVWGKNGPEWAGDQSNRVEIDFVFKRDLDNPKTEIEPPVAEAKRKAKR